MSLNKDEVLARYCQNVRAASLQNLLQFHKSRWPTDFKLEHALDRAAMEKLAINDVYDITDAEELENLKTRWDHAERAAKNLASFLATAAKDMKSHVKALQTKKTNQERQMRAEQAKAALKRVSDTAEAAASKMKKEKAPAQLAIFSFDWYPLGIPKVDCCDQDLRCTHQTS